jgi:pyridoxine kinase
LGFDVDFINSVQFSNHTEYKHVKGQRLNADELGDLFDGLRLNDLTNNYTHLLTGYVGNESFLIKLSQIITELKDKNSNLTYCKFNFFDLNLISVFLNQNLFN